MRKVIILVVVGLISLFSNPILSAAEDVKASYKAAYGNYKIFSEQEKWSEALPYAQKSYELGVPLFGESSKNSAALAYNYGLNLLNLNDNDSAIEPLEKAVGLYENIYGKYSEELIPVLMDLGDAKAETFDSLPQKKLYRRALNIVKKHHGKNSLYYGELSLEVGRKIMNLAQTTDAKLYFLNGYKILKKVLTAEDARIGLAAFQVGKFYLAVSSYRKSRDYFLEALSFFEQPGKPSNALELHTHGFLVDLYERMKQPENATKHVLAIGKMTPFKSKQEYRPLVKFAPKYPERSLRRREEGYVIVQFDVNKIGQVENITAIKNEGGTALIQAAIDAAEKFRYAPAFVDGQAVVTRGVQNIIRFKLAR